MKYNLRAIMKHAHQTRQEAANNFDCKVSEILFSECLKSAWQVAKGEFIEIEEEITEEKLLEKVEEIKNNFFYEEKFKKSYYSQKVGVWRKHGKCRIYIPRNAYEQAGYITLNPEDVRGRNAGEHKGIYYVATRPGNTSDLCIFIDELVK